MLPGVAPGLGGDDRRAVVFADNDDQAVGQRVQTDAGGALGIADCRLRIADGRNPVGRDSVEP